MNTNALLDLLEKDARLTVTDLADMLEEEEDTVRAEVKRLENDKIICGYHTVINYNRGLKDEKVMAFIEVDCRPTRDRGYDKTARLIASYPEVSTMYLLSGDCDFLCLVEGKTMFEVARFVYDKISAVEDVTSTKTLFVLKEYKKNGIMMKDEDEKKNVRFVVTP